MSRSSKSFEDEKSKSQAIVNPMDQRNRIWAQDHARREPFFAIYGKKMEEFKLNLEDPSKLEKFDDFAKSLMVSLENILQQERNILKKHTGADGKVEAKYSDKLRVLSSALENVHKFLTKEYQFDANKLSTKLEVLQQDAKKTGALIGANKTKDAIDDLVKAIKNPAPFNRFGRGG